jgi:putative flippase GtrA
MVLAFAVVGTATTIYNLLIKWVLDKLGGGIQQILDKKLQIDIVAKRLKDI